MDDNSYDEGYRAGMQRMREVGQSRIEELEASKNEALNQLDSALYSVSVLEKRVKSLIDESADLKAKLAKAVELGLEECPFWDGSGAYNDWWHDRRTTLKELTGDKDD